MSFCAKCSLNVLDGLIRCGNCGTPMPAMETFHPNMVAYARARYDPRKSERSAELSRAGMVTGMSRGAEAGCAGQDYNRTSRQFTYYKGGSVACRDIELSSDSRRAERLLLTTTWALKGESQEETALVQNATPETSVLLNTLVDRIKALHVESSLPAVHDAKLLRAKELPAVIANAWKERDYDTAVLAAADLLALTMATFKEYDPKATIRPGSLFGLAKMILSTFYSFDRLIDKLNDEQQLKGFARCEELSDFSAAVRIFERLLITDKPAFAAHLAASGLSLDEVKEEYDAREKAEVKKQAKSTPMQVAIDALEAYIAASGPGPEVEESPRQLLTKKAKWK